ncbi:hypothetical protein LEP1GSC145_0597 [Leptospira interrogans serovar Djasiman str. LT1649]|uniref:Uncharacterized protein n=2 Tax=Leptospira interrogans TaxID=173 RepID=M6HWH2_LEPIR|nr:hypothetical protein G436_2906 [Leptospira interrogans serovar Hardjo str. Norma]EKO98209.1 hypothetical protein LEP1GSC057_3598 [Leptospira interrogans str. Brem 329]EKR16819.1 hypothetical protein LEP1GSC019_2721 [Leptospira interrogans serovar Pyrogenes str. 2006006960]EMF73582.1 hypothetical protein LEP1GSC148_1464 [Leptospira interrogans serovar Canicola str. LT1962]EMJ52103.1 hypothetical protein LEP1GSC013_3309 [Leptospira interrogans serovar Valbuzzi str. Duyster]EMM91997.1 hypothet
MEKFFIILSIFEEIKKRHCILIGCTSDQASLCRFLDT